MKTSRVLLILAAILTFDLSLFQAVNALRPKWAADFNAPAQLLADWELSLAAGLFVSLLLAISGTYALSGAGLTTRLPFLRLGLFGSGCGYVFLGAFVLPRLLLGDPSPAPLRIQVQLVSACSVVLLAGLCNLAGLAFGWTHLSASAREVPGRCARQGQTGVAPMQDQTAVHG